MFHRLIKLNFRSIVKKNSVCSQKVGARDERGGWFISCSPKSCHGQILRIRYFSYGHQASRGTKTQGFKWNKHKNTLEGKNDWTILSLSRSDILVYYQMSCNFNKYFLFNSICPGKWVEYSQIAIKSVFGEKLQTILCKYISHGTATYRQAIWFRKKNEVSFQ